MGNGTFNGYRLLLGSKSPRRQELLNALRIPYQLIDIEAEEIYPTELLGEQIAIYLSELKAKAFPVELLRENDILITADTIVWLDNRCIGKPANATEASEMLHRLSGKTHSVFTGICLRSRNISHSFFSHTKVSFRELLNEEIDFYIENFKPFDKAGAYGIQEWIGYTGISSIEGCYYNVMGFPTQMFKDELIMFIQRINNA